MLKKNLCFYILLWKRFRWINSTTFPSRGWKTNRDFLCLFYVLLHCLCFSEWKFHLGSLTKKKLRIKIYFPPFILHVWATHLTPVSWFTSLTFVPRLDILFSASQLLSCVQGTCHVSLLHYCNDKYNRKNLWFVICSANSSFVSVIYCVKYQLLKEFKLQ